MYAKLKQLMKDHGYEVSEGGHWHASDTVSFSTFAHFVLGVPVRIAHRVLAYPHAFPQAIERLEKLVGIPVAAPAPVQTPPAPPVAPPADLTPPVVEQDDTHTEESTPSTAFDLSAQDNSEKEPEVKSEPQEQPSEEPTESKQEPQAEEKPEEEQPTEESKPQE